MNFSIVETTFSPTGRVVRDGFARRPLDSHNEPNMKNTRLTTPVLVSVFGLEVSHHQHCSAPVALF